MPGCKFFASLEVVKVAPLSKLNKVALVVIVMLPKALSQSGWLTVNCGAGKSDAF